MKSACCLALVTSLVAVTGHFAVPAQQQEQPKPFTSSMGMKFAWIPPGTFLMGSPKEEAGRDEKEVQHRVTLTKGFYLGVTTVTQEQWNALMTENPSRYKREKNLPVENVTWDECREFLKKMGDKDGQAYRLPTEAEWEYACRAGAKGLYCYGDDLKMLGRYAWYADNAEERPHSVAQKKLNRWGLHDMHGNVWEWCADWYGDYPRQGVADPQGPEKGTNRVLRGGSFYSPAVFVRSAIRGSFDPAKRGRNIGFRAVKCR
jgi:formylglycine-generating enzyme required for sulfatase activity